MTPSSKRSSRTGATARRQRGRGAAGAARPALGRDSQLHELLPGRAAVEHDSRGIALFRARAVDGPHGRSRVHPNVVEVRYRDQVVQTMPRLRKEDEHHIDYRHVIGWLVRKPGAFARTGIAKTSIPRSRSGAPTTRWSGRMASAPTSSICGSCTWPRPPAKRGWSRSSRRCSIRSAASTTSRCKRRSHRRCDGAGDPHSGAGSHVYDALRAGAAA